MEAVHVAISSTCARRLSVCPHSCSSVSSLSNFVMSLYPLHTSISYSLSPDSAYRVPPFFIPPFACRDPSLRMHPFRIQIPPHLAKAFQHESHPRSSSRARTRVCKSHPALQHSSAFPQKGVRIAKATSDGGRIDTNQARPDQVECWHPSPFQHRLSNGSGDGALPRTKELERLDNHISRMLSVLKATRRGRYRMYSSSADSGGENGSPHQPCSEPSLPHPHRPALAPQPPSQPPPQPQHVDRRVSSTRARDAKCEARESALAVVLASAPDGESESKSILIPKLCRPSQPFRRPASGVSCSRTPSPA